MTAIREAQYNMIIGAPGYGKSTWTAKHLQRGPRKNIIVYKTDLNLHDAAFKDYKVLDKLSDYRGGFAKISDLSIKYIPLLTEITKNFRNGALVVDDAAYYESHNTSDEFFELMRMKRHLGIDLYYIYHGLTDAPINHFRYVNHIVLFHTSDNPKYKASKLPDGGEQFFKAKEQLKRLVASGHKYQPVIVKLA